MQHGIDRFSIKICAGCCLDTGLWWKHKTGKPHAPVHPPDPGNRVLGGGRRRAVRFKMDFRGFYKAAIDFSRKNGILKCRKAEYPQKFSGIPRNRKAEDSLENTLNCVPKVQGWHAESLRQTDRDA